MTGRIEREHYRRFSRPSTWFSGIDNAAAAEIAAAGSDIVLVLSSGGNVEDLSYADPSLEEYAPETWIGRRWETTVTTECVDKIRAMISESGAAPSTRRRQVNHPAEGIPDLPVTYAVVALDGSSFRVALGQDLRKYADIQSRMLQNQIEMEREYRNLRQAETRYRILFNLLSQPMIVIDGENCEILDANKATRDLVGKSAGQLVGESVMTIFDRGGRKPVEAALETVRRRGTENRAQTRLAKQAGTAIVNVQPFRDGENVNFILKIRTPTQTGAATETRPSLDRDALFQAFPEAAVITDDTGRVELPNDQFLALAKAVSPAGIVGRNLSAWLGGSPVDMQLILSALKERGEIRNFATVFNDEFGAAVPVRIAARLHSAGLLPRIGFLILETGTSATRHPSVAGALPYEPASFGELVGRVPLKELLREASDIIEKLCIEAALRQTHNNRASAAEMLGLSRQSLYIKMRRHALGGSEVSD